MLLTGYRVLDLTDHRGEVGPWLLGRLGAEVLKIEPLGGSSARHAHPLASEASEGLQSLQFAAYNDNKRSIVLDLLHNEEDRATLLQLVAGAEFVFDSGPPGFLTAAGITEAELIAANPDLVFVLVTPFGSDGPRAAQPSSELTIAALGGPMSLQGCRERAPLKVSIPQVWRHAGAEAAAAALMGFTRMKATGGPQWIDVSAQAVMTWTMLNAMEAEEIQGFDFERAGAAVALAVKLDLLHETLDGYVVATPTGANAGPIVPWLIEEGIVAQSWAEEVWATFDHRFLSGQKTQMSFDDVKFAIDELCSRYSSQELLMRALPYGATLAPVNVLADVLTMEHLEVREFWASTRTDWHPSDARTVGAPFVMDHVRGGQPSAVPAIDGSGDEIRAAPLRERTNRRRTSGSTVEFPLHGVKVADFSWIGVGPITAKALADHGATVVKVESLNRIDSLRAQAPFKDAEFGLNRSNFFGSFNTSKRSVALDLSKPAGLRAAGHLTQWADVVIDSFRPGIMARLGLDHARIAVTNPNVITVTTSLFGEGGPLSPLAGYGFHAAAIAGFTDLVGWPDLPPDGPWMAYTDTIAPRFLTTAILAALDHRERTGLGTHIEGAQLEIAAQFLAPELLALQLTGEVPTRIGNRDPHFAPQGAYPCAGEDEWCALSVIDDGCWVALRGVLGDPHWARDPTLKDVTGRLTHHDKLDRHLREWTSTRRAEDVEQVLTAAGIPAGKVQRTRDLRVDPQYLQRQFYRRLAHSEVGVVPYAGHQYRVRGYDNGPRTAAPMLGEHTNEVLTELLGLNDEEIASLAIEDALT